ncbi:hypothetical protein [Rhizobium leguminosarum]|uniref:hypothetical protein n=1 Tax=Rhizobium leguminosarum TaxID=384 RepID=UPI001AE199FF|nr:hypothetical protein [Rhizobium leguminosarum]MBP2444835.1 hypothetical protein [Rhizobium leguminosarum]
MQFYNSRKLGGADASRLAIGYVEEAAPRPHYWRAGSFEVSDNLVGSNGRFSDFKHHGQLTWGNIFSYTHGEDIPNCI